MVDSSMDVHTSANDAFFDELGKGAWILLDILPCRPFGSKGFEKV